MKISKTVLQAYFLNPCLKVASETLTDIKTNAEELKVSINKEIEPQQTLKLLDQPKESRSVLPTISDKAKEEIRKHFLSYKFPYNPDDIGDLESLCRGFLMEMGYKIEAGQYYNAVIEIKETLIKKATLDENVRTFFDGNENYLLKVKQGFYPVKNVHNEFVGITESQLNIEEFKQELKKIVRITKQLN